MHVNQSHTRRTACMKRAKIVVRSILSANTQIVTLAQRRCCWHRRTSSRTNCAARSTSRDRTTRSTETTSTTHHRRHRQQQYQQQRQRAQSLTATRRRMAARSAAHDRVDRIAPRGRRDRSTRTTRTRRRQRDTTPPPCGARTR